MTSDKRQPSTQDRTYSEALARTVVASSDDLGSDAAIAGVPHVVFSGGGTAGHLFPGLAVAEALRSAAPEVRITFAGSGKEFERRHVSRASFDYLTLSCRPLPQSAGQVWRFLADHIGGTRAARQYLREQHVSLVVGLGGFASVPMARAAIRDGVPLVLLEQNAFPGRANRILARRARTICLALAQAKPHLRTSARVLVTGNPVRTEFIDSADSFLQTAGLGGTEPATRRLLVMGGSGGSSQLNEIVPKALHKVRSLLAGWHVVHQSGQLQRADTETLYRKLELPATVVPFVLNMSHVLRSSDLVVCRAGGTTLAELAVCGAPAVLVPWSEAAGDHQRRNAAVYTKIGAAITLDAAHSSGRLDDSLAELLVLPLGHPAIRQKMSAAMRKLARPKATEEIVAHLRELLSVTQQAAAA